MDVDMDLDMGLGNEYLHRTLARFCGLCTRAIKWFLGEWNKKINYRTPLENGEEPNDFRPRCCGRRSPSA